MTDDQLADLALQFGRGCKPAETRVARVGAVRVRNASIRPRLQARGNADATSATGASAPTLQFGRGCKPAETPVEVEVPVPVRVASIRPRLQARGNVY